MNHALTSVVGIGQQEMLLVVIGCETKLRRDYCKRRTALINSIDKEKLAGDQIDILGT
jgi:hypothetical protein